MSDDPIGPAYRILTPRLLLRCYEPSDAAALQDAIDASIDELAPWLPWVRTEPRSIAARGEALRQHRGRFDLGQEFLYGIFQRESGALLGGCGLSPRAGAAVCEIGYWIAAREQGRGLATEAAGALVRVAFEIDAAQRIEIHCDAENVRSLRVAEKLGFTRDGTLRQRLARSDGELGDDSVWSLLASEYAESPSASLEVEAFDAIDRPLIVRARRRSAFR